EPIPLIQNDSADFAAGADPVRENWNVGKMLPGWNALEDFWRPDADPREIVTPRMAVPVDHVDDTIPLERDIGAMFRFAQGDGDIVAGARMFFEEGGQVDVGQQIAA